MLISLALIAPLVLSGFVHKMRTEESDFVAKPAANSAIQYNVGTKVLTDDVNLYLVFYGNWSETQKRTLTAFANGIGETPWYGITKLYYSKKYDHAKRIFVDGKVKVAHTVSDKGSFGKVIKGSMIRNIIQSNVDKRKFPEDPNGIYFLLTAPEISESIRPDLGYASFCEDYCGYHISDVLRSGTRIQYGFAGIPDKACLNGCAPRKNINVSPNNDPGLDAAINAFAHELTEAVSDPISDIMEERAWEDAMGSENADKCAENYGSPQKLPSGASYNVEIGRKKFMIQTNWNPKTQKCTMSP